MQSGSSVRVGWNGTSVGTTSTNSLIRAFTQNGTAGLASGDTAQFDLDAANSYLNPFATVSTGTWAFPHYYINRNCTSGVNVWNIGIIINHLQWGDFIGYDHWPLDNRGRIELTINDPVAMFDLSIRIDSTSYIFSVSIPANVPPIAQPGQTFWPATGIDFWYGTGAPNFPGAGTSNQGTGGANTGLRYSWSLPNMRGTNFDVSLDIYDFHTGENFYSVSHLTVNKLGNPGDVFEDYVDIGFWRCPVFQWTIDP